MTWYTISKLETLPAPDWLIKDWLPTRSAAQLSGPSGIGKTFMAIDWSCTLAASRYTVACGTPE